MRSAHARRGRTAGAGLTQAELTPDIIARFHAKHTTSSGCWLWTASKFPKGYGQFALYRITGVRQVKTYAHRVAYVIAKGDIPQGAIVMHSCDVPSCVNPDHLTLGTQFDNIADARKKGRTRYPGPTARKLSDDDVRSIRSSPLKSIRLAERYGVTLSCISQIRNGRSRTAVA